MLGGGRRRAAHEDSREVADGGEGRSAGEVAARSAVGEEGVCRARPALEGRAVVFHEGVPAAVAFGLERLPLLRLRH